MEEKIGKEFKSIQPDFTNIQPASYTTAGAVYNGQGGLFASDRRANNVGDIITITLEENMAAANSGSETLSAPSLNPSRTFWNKHIVTRAAKTPYILFLRERWTIPTTKSNLPKTEFFIVATNDGRTNKTTTNNNK